MKELLILCGGQSPEHEISVRSTKNVLKELDRTKYLVSLIGITKEGIWRHIEERDLGDRIVAQGKTVRITPGVTSCFSVESGSLPAFDVVFPVLHGINGEDGTVQGILELLRLPYVGSGVLGSSVCMDKDTTKCLLRDAGLKVADWLLIWKGEEMPSFDNISKKLGNVVFVKPANMGSSVGVHRVSDEKTWGIAIDDALKYDRKVLVESALVGKELECAILGNADPQTSGIGEVQLKEGFYSYDEKYASSSVAEIVIPAAIDQKHLPKLKTIAIEAYKALKCEGMARVDMFLSDDDEKIYINEVNTIPGFTSISMYPKLWGMQGICFAELIDLLVELALERR